MKPFLRKTGAARRPLSARDKRIASAFLIALAIAFALFAFAFRGAFVSHDQKLEDGSLVQVNDVGREVYRHPLTGLTIDAPLAELPQVIAVMIDHHAAAWPQVGTDRAFLVIEAPVEGNIPRLEAFFLDTDVIGEIGPIRSARPYYVDWADELDALYAHVGGSPEALELIKSRGIFDLNQFFYGSTFWRTGRKEAPHNVLTSTELLGKALADAHADGRAPDLVYGVWKFLDARPKTPESGPGISVNYNGSEQYTARWEYKALDNVYLRYQGAYPYKTGDEQNVRANNVAVVITDIEVIDDVGRKKLRTIGEGEAMILQNGALIEGTWKKPSVTERLRFYDASGEEIAMNPGVTWIEVVGSKEAVTINE